jgi:hypothetical protein
MDKSNEGIKIKGIVEYISKDKNGNIKEIRTIPNLITNAGKSAVAGLLLSDVSVDSFDAIAIGTGTNEAEATDTTLQTETSRRGGANVTGTRVTTNVTNDTAQLSTTFTFDSEVAITESGVFNHNTTGGDMLARHTFSALNFSDGDSLQVNWKIVIEFDESP